MIDANLIDTGLGAVAAVGVVGVVANFRPSQRRPRPTAATEPAEPEIPTAELDRRSSSALVAADDRLAGAEQELGFAQAQFGGQATTAFQSVLTQSRARLTEAFALRQRLDDADPDPEADRREWCSRILELCSAVVSEIAAHEDEFVSQRAQQDRAPATLDEVEAQVTETRERIAGARATLGALEAQLPAGALSTLQANPDHAEQLLTAAATAVVAGRASLGAGDRRSAVTQSRIAVAGLTRAVALLDSVDSAQDDLTAAPARIAARLSSLGSDLRDAARLAPGDPGVAPLAAAARDAVKAAQQPDLDLLATLAELEKCEAALDAALAPIRHAAEEGAKTISALTTAIGSTVAAINGVEGLIDTRRPAVGAEARTRLAQAQRLVDEAQAIQRSDPAGALDKLREAGGYADQARQLAQDDVDRWDDRQWLRDGAKFVSALVLGMLENRGL